jgi:hypothetical protein
MALLIGSLSALPVEAASQLIAGLQQNEATILRSQPNEPYFAYIKGTIPILISAPHGARHFRTRENRLKGADAYTAAMAMELGRLTGAHVIYTRSQAPEDPNNDPRTRYKDALAAIVKENGIRFVMDLHGAHGRHTFTIDVGTFSDVVDVCSCPLLLETIRRSLSSLPGVRFNSRFSASGKGTVTYFAHENLRVDAAQFEINGRYRIPMMKGTTGGAVENEREIAAAIEGLRTVIVEIVRVLSDSPAAGGLPPPTPASPSGSSPTR